MNAVRQDQEDQAAAEPSAPGLRYGLQQETKPNDGPSVVLKTELLDNHGSDVISEELDDLPPDLMAKMPTGKRVYGSCIRKQSQGVTVYVLGSDMWQVFYAEGNEMIITKKGRRMFPVPTFIICDLDTEKLYDLSLELNSVDNNVYKYINGTWVPSKEGSYLYPTPVPGRNACLHHSSPNTGLYWMKEPVSFATLKISNNLDALGTIVLQSMRKYVMTLIIGEMKGTAEVRIVLSETAFVAVTQYQNENITKMKIEYNPFANAFRMTSNKSKDKSKRQHSVEADSEDESRPPEVSSSNQTPGLSSGQLRIENVWGLDRSEIWCTNPVQLATYLEQKRQVYQKFLPSYSDQLNLTSLKQDQSTQNNFAGWQPVLLPPGVAHPLHAHPLHKTPELSDVSATGRFMFPVNGVNPLAQIRHFGERNPCSDMEAPLPLVKKMKTGCNTISAECNSNNSTFHCKSTHNCRQNPRHTRNVPRKIENDELNEARTGGVNTPSLYGQRVPDVGYVPLCSGDGHTQSNPAVPGEDVSGHNHEMANLKHVKFMENKAEDTAKTLTEDQEASTDVMTPTNYKSSTSQFTGKSPALVKPDVTLRNIDLWAATHEVVVSSSGRSMFPFIALSVNKLLPDRQYIFGLKLVPFSNFFYDYNDHEWVPSQQAPGEPKDAIYPHPDNPKNGRQWGSLIIFDKLRLSTLKQGKNLLKVQFRRQYLPHVVIRTHSELWEYPLKDAIFITVKVDRSPYLMSRLSIHHQPSSPERQRASSESLTGRQKNPKLKRTETVEEIPERTWTLGSHQARHSPHDLKAENDTTQTTSVSVFPETPVKHMTSATGSAAPRLESFVQREKHDRLTCSTINPALLFHHWQTVAEGVDPEDMSTSVHMASR